jgi:cobalt/nickel transport system ATP-binding protein
MVRATRMEPQPSPAERVEPASRQPPPLEPAIQVRSLHYTYPDGYPALKEITFQIDAAERVALVGANGSGKSTLLHQLNGLLQPQGGEIQIDHMVLHETHLPTIRNQVGLVFQNPDDQIFMPTVWDDIAAGPKNQGLRGGALTHRTTLAMLAVGLDPEAYADRLAHHLSGGEKKRVAIAGVLAMQPQVLLLDEPTAQLDPRSRRQLIHLLASLPQTQLIATHDLDLALDLCCRTIVLHQGQLVYDGTTEAIFSDSDRLQQYALESPLSYCRPYCLLKDAPAVF